MRFNSCCKCLWVLVLIFAGKVLVTGQNFAVLYNYMPEDKEKQLDKALLDLTEAGKLIQEANTYYNEASELQTNYELSEKKLQKKLSKAEKKALSIHSKADKLYTNAYKTLYNLANEQVAVLSVNDQSGLVEEASGLMEEAGSLRKEAGSERNTYLKAELLNKATEREGAAIENLVMVLETTRGIKPETSPEQQQFEVADYERTEESATTVNQAYTSAIDVKSEDLVINMAMVEQYQRYVSNPAIPDPVRYDPYNPELTTPTLEDARDYLLAYQGSSLTTEGLADQVRDEPVVAMPEESVGQAEEITHSSVRESPEEIRSTNELLTESEIYSSEPVNDGAIPDRETTSHNYAPLSSATDVRFMVQIAASRAPLNRRQIWAILPGNFTVEIMEEEGWYKYRITGFRLFSDAIYLARRSGVNGAWVLAQQNGKTLPMAEAREIIKLQESNAKRYGRDALSDEMDYYVQVAASRIRLSEETRNELCRIQQCREIIEDGWFKYQLYGGTEFSKAADLQDQIGKSTFIVAYQRGVRVNPH